VVRLYFTVIGDVVILEISRVNNEYGDVEL